MHSAHSRDSGTEKQLIIRSTFWPFVFVAIMWIIKLFELASGVSLSEYGMAPRNFNGLYGIITYPFLHKDFSHLTSNSIPLIFLGSALFYYYKEASRMILLQLFVISGAWLWVMGQYGSIHIGASGLVYGLTAFHVTAGLIKRNKHLLAFSLLVMFLYGSMVWGVFPDFYPKRNISWEGHFAGMAAGILLAWFHRNQGPSRDRYEWEEEEDDDDEEEEEDNLAAASMKGIMTGAVANTHKTQGYKSDTNTKKADNTEAMRQSVKKSDHSADQPKEQNIPQTHQVKKNNLFGKDYKSDTTW